MSAHRLRYGQLTVAAAAAVLLLAVGAPCASADPGTDALGFVDSTARCAAPDTAVAFGSTANSRVAICKSSGGQYAYRGVRISDGAKLIASATAAADGSYVAKHDGISYTVTSSALIVSDSSGEIRREPMLSFHGPKTTQAPGAAAQSPSTAPKAPPTSTAPSAPLPPPLPAEVGGKR